MKLLLFTSLFYYVYARIYAPSASVDEPFEANNGLFYENAAVESGETFTEERLEQELLNSIAPTKTFKGTIVARQRTSPPSSRPIEKEDISFNEDVSTITQDDVEGSAEIEAEEKSDNSTIVDTKTKKSLTDIQLPVLLGLSSPIFTLTSSENDGEKATTLMIDVISSPLRNTDEDEEGSGKSTQESPFPLDLDGFGEVPINHKSILIGANEENEESKENLKVVKVSGEIGEDPAEGLEKEETATATEIEIKREDKQLKNPEKLEKKPVSSGTFLEDNLLPVFLRKKQSNSSSHVMALRGAIDGCPTPNLCAKNCFVSLDTNGCQTCECLWQALTCETNDDCPEAIQVCDLGKCECSQGYEQDMSRSGMCKAIQPDVIVNDEAAVLQAEKLFEESAKSLPEFSVTANKRAEQATTSVPLSLYYGKKHVRVIRATDRLRRPERLQWPDKPIRRRSRSRQRDSIPDSFIISNDDEEEYEDVSLHDGHLTMPITTTTKPRGLLRFVSEDTTVPFKLRTERTTVIPPATNVFEISSQSFQSNTTVAQTPFHPDTVKVLGETTKTEMVHSNILNSDLESFGSPPAPPPVDAVSSLLPITITTPSIGSVSRDKITRTFKLSDEQIADMTKAFTKSIALPKTEILKPILKPKRKQIETAHAKVHGVETVTELNEFEFPISSQLRKLKNAGIEVTPPPALSAKPTSEELEGHVQFMKAMNAQRERVQFQFEKKSGESPKTQKSFDYEEPSTTTILTTTSISSNEIQKAGIWYDMENPDGLKNRLNERRRAPISTTSPRLYMEYTEKNVRGRPIRVEGRVIGTFDDECGTDKDCGSRFKCCPKQWCDERATCGKAKFCLPNCLRTKLVNANSLDKSLLDIVYD